MFLSGNGVRGDCHTLTGIFSKLMNNKLVKILIIIFLFPVLTRIFGSLIGFPIAYILDHLYPAGFPENSSFVEGFWVVAILLGAIASFQVCRKIWKYDSDEVITKERKVP